MHVTLRLTQEGVARQAVECGHQDEVERIAR